MQKFLRAFLSLLILVGTVICIRIFTPPRQYKVKSPSRVVMGTFADIIAVAENNSTANQAIDAAFKQLMMVDEMMSDYSDDSEIAMVNRQAHENPVEISDELFEVLQAAVKYSLLSNGQFDVTIGPVVQLWRQAEITKTKPTDEQIAAAKSKVGYDKLILDPENKSVKFAVEGMILDLGAIAKGYAIDLAVNSMLQTGATGGMVNAGGDIRTFGKPENKRYWNIALQDPKAETGVMLVLNLNDNAVATSGDYRRFVVLDDQKYSHIIAPQKGSSATDFTSVSILAKTAMDADALATTVSIMGPEKGIELIESLPETEAYLVPSDIQKEPVFTTGFRQYIRKE